MCCPARQSSIVAVDVRTGRSEGWLGTVVFPRFGILVLRTSGDFLMLLLGFISVFLGF